MNSVNLINCANMVIRNFLNFRIKLCNLWMGCSFNIWKLSICFFKYNQFNCQWSKTNIFFLLMMITVLIQQKWTCCLIVQRTECNVQTESNMEIETTWSGNMMSVNLIDYTDHKHVYTYDCEKITIQIQSTQRQLLMRTYWYLQFGFNIHIYHCYLTKSVNYMIIYAWYVTAAFLCLIIWGSCLIYVIKFYFGFFL